MGWLYQVSTTGSNKFGTVTKTKGEIIKSFRHGLTDYLFKGRKGNPKYMGSNIKLFDGYYYDRSVYLENENDARAKDILAQNLEYKLEQIEARAEIYREVIELLRGE